MSRQPPADVVAGAQAAQRAWRVPASVSLGQWALESGWGEHMPPSSNNPFGIKARPGEAAVFAPTKEVVHGQWIMVKAAFRHFDSLAAAFARHAELLATARCYAPAMRCSADVDAFVRAIAGPYATDPGYAAKLLAVIDGSDLRRFDLPSSPPAAFGRGALIAAIRDPGERS